MTEFIELVAEMRRDQREYFRSRTVGTLNRSLRSEKQVDQALLAIASGQRQRKLFDQEACD